MSDPAGMSLMFGIVDFDGYLALCEANARLDNSVKHWHETSCEDRKCVKCDEITQGKAEAEVAAL